MPAPGGAARPGECIAIRLFAPVRYLVVGSPEHLRRDVRPGHPRDLTARDCLCGRIGQTLYGHWEFESAKGEFAARAKGSLIQNDADLTIEAAAEGAGLAHVPDEAVRERLAISALEIVLDGFACGTDGFYRYYPSRSKDQPKLRAFVDRVLAHRNSRRDRSASRHPGPAPETQVSSGAARLTNLVEGKA